MTSPSSVVCERVRGQVSLQLDSELSELERRMVAGHLERCPACSAFAEGVSAVTELIRSAPLETSSRPVLVRGGRRLATARFQISIAAALALVALGLGSQLASLESQNPALSRFDNSPNLSPPSGVLEREQAIMHVVRPGTTLPPPGSVL